MNQQVAELAEKFARNHETVETIWQAGRTVFAKVTGRVWAEIEPFEKPFMFKWNRKHISVFPISDAQVLWRTIAWEELVEAWAKHTLMARLVRRHLDTIEGRLWAVPSGRMVQRLWHEILNT